MGKFGDMLCGEIRLVRSGRMERIRREKALQKKGHLSETLREMGKDIPGGQGRAHTKMGM